MQPETQPPVTPPPASVPGKSKSKIKKILLIAGTVIIALIVIWVGLALFVASRLQGNNPTDPLSTLFYSTLSNASQQTKVHFAFDSTGYPSQAAQSAGQTPDRLTSVSEFDTGSKAYSTVYASGGSYDGVGRCVNNQIYTLTDDKFAASYDEAVALLSQGFSVATTPPATTSPCAYNGAYRYGKLTDGIIPIGLTKQQADSWTTYLKGVNMFVLKDEGMVQYQGKSGHKISFTLGTYNSQKLLSDSFYFAERDGATGQKGGNKVDPTYFDDSLGEAGGADLSGYYIIDEAAKLPIYSQFTKHATPDTADSFAPLTTQQQYQYDKPFTITPTTQLATF